MVAQKREDSDQLRHLFGGAINISIPAEFADISLVRQIPENQEVFSHADTDRSLIIELLEMHQLQPNDPLQPAAFHIANLADETAAIQAHTHHVVTLPPADFPSLHADDPQVSVSIAYATHVISKYRDADHLANRVDVHLACVRLPRATTDLLVVFNDPVALHPSGSSARSGSAVIAPSPTGSRDAVLRAALTTLNIHDWTLFQ